MHPSLFFPLHQYPCSSSLYCITLFPPSPPPSFWLLPSCEQFQTSREREKKIKQEEELNGGGGKLEDRVNFLPNIQSDHQSAADL
mmetsp:Transcript_40249/g.79380  ORF Transcript_40249/g.79380 Transcript_40249/m.79380 type:complete len:85 (+) Transcript_40249:152-406(+)